jgi:hypothetical protein
MTTEKDGRYIEYLDHVAHKNTALREQRRKILEKIEQELAAAAFDENVAGLKNVQEFIRAFDGGAGKEEKEE